jgi:tripartite-type tricarboxylate transporter receptor subunit TctC
MRRALACSVACLRDPTHRDETDVIVMAKERKVQTISVRAAAVVILCGVGAVAAAAERYPTRPIRFVVGFLPGGPSDTLARLVGAKLSEQVGQAVIVDNRAGAGGNVAAEIAAVASPDGHTIMLGTGGPFVIAPITGQKVRFNPDRDFAPVTKLGDSMSLLAAHPSTGFNHWKDLVAAAKAKPGEINYASSGVGTIHHLAAELLSSMTGIRMNHIPYKGSGAVLPAMLSGEVRVGFGPILPAIPHVKAGRLKALGVGGAKRSGAAPDIPTMAEQGLPGYEASSWYGVFVPAKTPPDVVARLHKELVAAVAAPEVHDRLARDGIDPATSSPEQLMERVRSERKTWGKVIKDANLKIN